jgi:hypothetical protein
LEVLKAAPNLKEDPPFNNIFQAAVTGLILLHTFAVLDGCRQYRSSLWRVQEHLSKLKFFTNPLADSNTLVSPFPTKKECESKLGPSKLVRASSYEIHSRQG